MIRSVLAALAASLLATSALAQTANPGRPQAPVQQPQPNQVILLPLQEIETIVQDYLSPNSVARGVAFAALDKLRACTALQIPGSETGMDLSKCPEIMPELAELHRGPGMAQPPALPVAPPPAIQHAPPVPTHH